MNKINKETIINFLIIIFGNLLLAIGYIFFVDKVGVVTGGLAGIGTLIKQFVNIPLSLTVAIGTWGLFVIGFVFLGKEFAIKTLLSSIVYPIFTFLCERLNIFLENAYPEIFELTAIDTGTTMLYAIFGSIFIGFGIGLVFKKGGSTGGLDIPCLLIAKKFKVGVDRMVFMTDSIIVVTSIFIFGLERALIGVLGAYVCGMMIDKAIISGSESLMIHVLSEKHEEINQYINYTMERGTTYIHGEGGYTAQNKKIIEVVIGRREYHTLKDEIHKIDPNAFMIVLNAKDVFGYGFKDYHKDK